MHFLYVLLFLLSTLSFGQYNCTDSWNRGYKQGSSEGYTNGYRQCKRETPKPTACTAEQLKDSYDRGFIQGDKGGHARGLGEGDKIGYDRSQKECKKDGDDRYEQGDADGYQRAKDKYDTGSGDDSSYGGRCAFVFDFDDVISITDIQCNSPAQCEDNNRNTLNVCVLSEE